MAIPKPIFFMQKARFFPKSYKIFLLTNCLFLLSYIISYGSAYFVDAQNGNDSYNGAAPVHQGGNNGPWKSISKVNRTTFQPGDRILFARGGVWTDGPLDPKNGGTSGETISVEESILSQPIQFELVDPDPSANNCVYFGAYGSGDKPRIECAGGHGLILRHNYIIVENLHLNDGGNNMLEFSRTGGNYWNVVRNIDVTNCSSNAVRFENGGGNCWLDGLYVYNFESNGIYLAGSESNPLKQVLVENCRVENPVVIERRDAISCHRSGEFNISGEIIIRNNTIVRSGEDGIDITSGTRILLDGNIVEHSRSAGIFVGKPERVHTVEIRGNFLNSNSISQGKGDLSIETSKVRAVNNIIVGTGHHSLLLESADGLEIWHNVIAPGNRTGNFIWIREGLNNVDIHNNIFDFSNTEQTISGSLDLVNLDYNCYFGRSSSQEIYSSSSFEELQGENASFEPNGFWSDPLFMDQSKSLPAHFMLHNNSPCQDRGMDLPVEADSWGVQRPQGGGWDIGVFEIKSGDPSCPPVGTPCDDGNSDTENDVEDGNCNCSGTATCPPAGTTCDDGDSNTENDQEDGNCNCSGTPSGNQSIIAQVTQTNDDVEERKSDGKMNMTSSDLELGYEGDESQIVGIRFNHLPIPQGAYISGAYLQFTVDETASGGASVNISAQKADHAPIFTSLPYELSSRNKTDAIVGWAIPDWPDKAESGANQQTPDLSAIVQEIVNRPNWAAGNSIAFLIEGNGTRTAESYDGSEDGAPKLVLTFTADCPDAGTICDDYDPSTYDEMEDGNCNCVGTPCLAAGTPCDDGNPDTENDQEDGQCNCIGFACPETGTACDDDNPSTYDDVEDGACNCSGTPCLAAGTPCDDGDSNTENDREDGQCNCAGTPKGVQTTMISVSREDDDAEESSSSGSVNLSSSDLELGYRGRQIVGVRFNNLDIPKGAVIIDAHIQFTVDESDEDESLVSINAQATDHAPAFTSSSYDISSRSKTEATINWAISNWPSEGEADVDQKTPDLSTIVQEVVDRSGWAVGNAIVFLIEGTGTRTAESYDGSEQGAPKLMITYTSNCPAAGTPCDDGNPNTSDDVEDGFCHCAGTSNGTSMIEAQVNQEDDDVEESASSGSMNMNSSDLELSDSGKKLQIVGIRFNKLNIPQGALISKAYIQFTTDETDSGEMEVIIKGEASDDAPIFKSSTHNVSSRSKTGAEAVWSAPAWLQEGVAGPNQQTPDLSAIVQEIVARPGWTAGNSMVFILEGNGTRTAESYNGSAEGAPKLIVEFTEKETSLNAQNARRSFLTSETPAAQENIFQIELFPNPVTEQLTLRFQLKTADVGLAEMFVRDINGKIIATKSFRLENSARAEHILDVRRLSAGFYTVSLHADKEMLTKRFVKVRR